MLLPRRTFRPLLLLLVPPMLVCWWAEGVEGKPVNYASSVRDQKINSETLDRAVDFLSKYGYLPMSNLETGNLRTEEELQNSIRTMQRFGGIQETGVIDADTVKLMRSKRCGIPDLVGTGERVRRYALQGAKWDKLVLTWRIEKVQRGLDYYRVRDMLTRAFKVWSDASRLEFNEVSTHEADIIISFYGGFHGDGFQFDGPGSVLAHAFFPGGGLGGDTHFDDEEQWDTTHEMKSDRVNLFAVAAHEFGHSLGLSHSREKTALMFPYYQWIGPEYKLPDDDRMGIQQLYGAKYEQPWATLPNFITRSPHPVPRPTRPPPPPTRRPQPPDHPQPPRPTSHFPTDEEQTTGRPNKCDTSYDAIAVLRHELFIFKNQYYWRLNDRELVTPTAMEIKHFWYHLPEDLKHIDAVYERPKDGNFVFFIGKQYWVFGDNSPLPGYPRPLTHLGLPKDLTKIDAAMVWGHNGKTYLFSGRHYWRFDENDGKVELDYPRDMAMWGGVPYHLDSAFQWTDGRTYFFKDKGFWKFNDKKMRVENQSPLMSAPFWMSCPHSSIQPDKDDQMPTFEEHDGHVSDQAAHTHTSLKRTLLVVLLTIFVTHLL